MLYGYALLPNPPPTSLFLCAFCTSIDYVKLVFAWIFRINDKNKAFFAFFDNSTTAEAPMLFKGYNFHLEPSKFIELLRF